MLFINYHNLVVYSVDKITANFETGNKKGKYIQNKERMT